MEEQPTCSIRWLRKGWHLGCLCSVFQVGCFRQFSLQTHESFGACPGTSASCHGAGCGVCSDSQLSEIGLV